MYGRSGLPVQREQSHASGSMHRHSKRINYLSKIVSSWMLLYVILHPKFKLSLWRLARLTSLVTVAECTRLARLAIRTHWAVTIRPAEYWALTRAFRAIPFTAITSCTFSTLVAEMLVAIRAAAARFDMMTTMVLVVRNLYATPRTRLASTCY